MQDLVLAFEIEREEKKPGKKNDTFNVVMSAKMSPLENLFKKEDPSCGLNQMLLDSKKWTSLHLNWPGALSEDEVPLCTRQHP